jgi:hypothetical protein
MNMAKPANNMAISIRNMSFRFDNMAQAAHNMAQTSNNLAFGHERKLLLGEKLVSMNRLSCKWGDILEM